MCSLFCQRAKWLVHKPVCNPLPNDAMSFTSIVALMIENPWNASVIYEGARILGSRFRQENTRSLTTSGAENVFDILVQSLVWHGTSERICGVVGFAMHLFCVSPFGRGNRAGAVAPLVKILRIHALHPAASSSACNALATIWGGPSTDESAYSSSAVAPLVSFLRIVLSRCNGLSSAIATDAVFQLVRGRLHLKKAAVALDALTPLISILCTFNARKDVVKNASNAIASITRGCFDPASVLAIEPLIAALRIHASSETVVAAVSAAIAAIASHPHGRRSALSTSIPLLCLLINLLRTHEASPIVCRDSVGAIAQLCRDPKGAEEALALHACAPLISVLRRHGGNEIVCAETSFAIASLCKNSPNKGPSVMAAIAPLVVVLRAQGRSSLICADVSDALMQLCKGTPEGIQMALELGAIASLVESFRVNVDNNLACLSSSRALGEMCSSPRGVKLACESNALFPLVEALGTCMAREETVWAISGTMWLLCTRPSGVDAALNAGAMTPLVQALGMHSTNVFLCERVCSIICTVARLPVASAIFISDGAVPCLVSVLSRHGVDRCPSAQSALATLGFSDEGVPKAHR